MSHSLALQKSALAESFLTASKDPNHSHHATCSQDYLLSHASAVDVALIKQFNAQPKLARVALIATGGYGRQELYPFSDIDILLLRENSSSEDEARLIDNAIGIFLQQLWDQGLPMSHAVRTLVECEQWSKEDISIQTALLEARYLAGPPALMTALTHMMTTTLSVVDFFTAKSIEQKQRHQRYQNIDSSLEPNIKESPGGLRELHLLRWIERAMSLQNSSASSFASPLSWQTWQKRGWLSPEESKDIHDIEQFLRRLRIHLHLQSLRAQDKLLFDIQSLLAEAMGYLPHSQAVDKLSPAEHMMKDYYRHALQGLSLNQLILSSIGAELSEVLTPPEQSTSTLSLSHGLIISTQGSLDVINVKPLTEHPEHMLKPFLWRYQIEQVQSISPKLKRLLRSLRHRINEVRDHDCLKADFLAIIQLPHGTITTLRELNRLGFLGEYLPAFGSIVGLMQHDLYHAYTVDQHILMVIRNVRRLMLDEFSHEYPEHSQLMASFPHPWRLVVAALFHDIAKGRGGSHSSLGAIEAEKFCSSHGLSLEDTSLIVWLVKEHLSFSKTAQREDLSDPLVIAQCAELVKTPERLDALFLLTTADIRGTSPKVWNQWKGNLLSDLRRRVMIKLTENSAGDSFEPSRSLTDIKKQEVLELLRMVGVDGEKMWRSLPTNYTHVFSANAISWHYRVLLRYESKPQTDNYPFIVAVRRADIGHHGELVLMINQDLDHHAFSKTCGHLAHLGYSVMGARVALWRERDRLYHFEIAPSHNNELHDDDRGRMAVLEYTLSERLQSPDTPAPLMTRIPRQLRMSAFRPQLRLVLDESGQRFILTIATIDRLGLLYDLTRVFSTWSANLHYAKINTLGNRAENVFVLECPALHTTNALMQFERQLMDVLAF